MDADHVRFVGGVDLSFVKDKYDIACAAYVICDLENDLEVVYEKLEVVNLETEYVPGFLAFREAEPLKKLIGEDEKRLAQVVLVDGNGILHPERFGLASHLGVIADTPTVGVAKNLYQTEDLLRDAEFKGKVSSLSSAGDAFDLMINSELVGLALKTKTEATNPVVVSVGHKIDLETAKRVVLKTSKFRIPEPIRQADIRSREYIRTHFKQH